METLYLVMRRDDEVNLTQVMIGFTNKDLAILHCAKFNIDNQDRNVAYYISQSNLNNEEPEIFIDDNLLTIAEESPITLEIQKIIEEQETLYHEEMPPNIEKIVEFKLANSDIESIGLSEELLKNIKFELTLYGDMITHELKDNEEYED